MILSCVVIFNSSTPQTRKEDVVEDLQVQGQGLAITNFLFCMVWTFAYPAYIKFPGQEMPDFYPVFTLFNAWMGLVIFIFLGLSSKRFRFVLSRWKKKCMVGFILIEFPHFTPSISGEKEKDRSRGRCSAGSAGDPCGHVTNRVSLCLEASLLQDNNNRSSSGGSRGCRA